MTTMRLVMTGHHGIWEKLESNARIAHDAYHAKLEDVGITPLSSDFIEHDNDYCLPYTLTPCVQYSNPNTKPIMSFVLNINDVYRAKLMHPLASSVINDGITHHVMEVDGSETRFTLLLEIYTIHDNPPDV